MSNRSSILKLLNDCGAMSRKDIAIELGLTPATVTLICTELISAGILCEKGEVEEERRAGRRKVLIDINYQYRYVLSVSIEAAKTCIAISNLKGLCLGAKWISSGAGKPQDRYQPACVPDLEQSGCGRRVDWKADGFAHHCGE